MLTEPCGQPYEGVLALQFLDLMLTPSVLDTLRTYSWYTNLCIIEHLRIRHHFTSKKCWKRVFMSLHGHLGSPVPLFRPFEMVFFNSFHFTNSFVLVIMAGRVACADDVLSVHEIKIKKYLLLAKPP
jgi:hypothetical protein